MVKKYYTWDANARVEIRDSFGAEEIPVIIPEILKEAAEKYGDKFALAFMEKGQQKKVKFSEYYAQVKRVAKAFLKLGLQRYHAVCILSSNSPEWFYSNLAAIMAGGISCGIYTSNSPEACLHCLRISDANIVIVENDNQLQKILKIRDQAPKLKTIIQVTGRPKNDSVLSWQMLLDIGSREPEGILTEIIKQLVPNECSTLLFTSGTTGPPKAVMLSHDNLIFKSKVTEKSLQIKSDNRRVLSYLPLSHVAAQVFDLYKGLIAGVCVFFADDGALRDTIVENLKAVKPTEFLAVPRIWEKIKEYIDVYMKNSLTASQYNDYKISDSYILNRSDDELLCIKIRKLIGFDDCQIFQSGAAPISPYLKSFFSRLNIPLAEVFGLTETSGGFISPAGQDPDSFIFSCGKPLLGIRVKIHQPNENNIGELCAAGRQVFMGYLKNPQATKAVTDDDGFFHTGDLALYDQNFSYRITGRIKELIITSGGENISPTLIELEVKNELPFVSHAVVVGDGKKYLSVLITLKANRNTETGSPTDELSSDTKYWYKSLGSDYEQISEILRSRSTEVYQAIQEGINRVNAKAISSAQRIQKFTILPKDFTNSTGELGATSKLLRSVIYEKYKLEIDAMYAD